MHTLDDIIPCDGTLSPSELAAITRSVAIDEARWRPIVRHDSAARFYTRLHWSPDVEVWLLGWDTDQDTRIHDHGGSAGAVSVTEGELFEEHGKAGRDRALRMRTHARGATVAFGPDYVHNLGNRAATPATSIHAYSPPLTVMRFYEPDERGRLHASYELPVAGPEPDDEALPTRLTAGA